MSVLNFIGFETGDGNQIGGLTSGCTIVTDFPNTGTYAIKGVPSAGSVFQTIDSGLSLSAVWSRIWLRPSVVGSPSTAAALQFQLRYATDFLSLVNVAWNGTDFTVSAAYRDNSGSYQFPAETTTIPADTYSCIEMVVQGAAAGSGNLAIRVNGVALLTYTTLDIVNTNVTNVLLAHSRVDASNYVVGRWDDYARGNDWCGQGRCIARQGKAGSSTYTAFTKTGGNIDVVWSETPFSATNNAKSTAQNQAQTMLLADVGAGINPIGTSDTINACLVVGIAKLLAGTNKRTYSVRKRMNGADTDVSITTQVSTAGDALFQGTVFTDTIAHLQGGEIGVLRGATTANSQEIQVEDMWLMVDYTPVALFLARPPLVLSTQAVKRAAYY